jgi:hypothetical protein
MGTPYKLSLEGMLPSSLDRRDRVPAEAIHISVGRILDRVLDLVCLPGCDRDHT